MVEAGCAQQKPLSILPASGFFRLVLGSYVGCGVEKKLWGSGAFLNSRRAPEFLRQNYAQLLRMCVCVGVGAS